MPRLTPLVAHPKAMTEDMLVTGYKPFNIPNCKSGLTWNAFTIKLKNIFKTMVISEL